jgi:hypothetical protein
MTFTSTAQSVQLNGVLGMIDVAQAPLFARLGDRDAALRAVAAVRAFVNASGLGFTLRSLTGIATELGL